MKLSRVMTFHACLIQPSSSSLNYYRWFPLSQTLCRLLHVADAKGRKRFVQGCREASISLADVAFNSVSNIVILKLLSCVDDTRLLKELVLSPILNVEIKSALPKQHEDGNTLKTVCMDQSARKVLLMLLYTEDNCNRYFSQKEKRLVITSSPTRYDKQCMWKKND